MTCVEDVVIVGGGPAGAYCAFELARKGIYATIFDHSHPREKPCGGGISHRAVAKFPFLEKFRSGDRFFGFKMISCTNRQTTFADNKARFYLSRRLFDEEIIKMAIQQGARLIKEKVLDVEKKQVFWKIKTTKRLVKARFVIGADGIRSLVRRKTVGPIQSRNIGLTYGYLSNRLEEPPTIKFVAEIPGYIWIFPRDNQSCIGIGSEARYGSLLRGILDDFVRSYCPRIMINAKFAAMLPWATDPEFFTLPCAGEDWLLVGDAAGHADPLTGEGILYALWSGKLAAEVLAKREPTSYDGLWRTQYGNYFMHRCGMKNEFYDPIRIELSVVSSLRDRFSDFY
jgi:geranylgeranyl reductase family protein